MVESLFLGITQIMCGSNAYGAIPIGIGFLVSSPIILVCFLGGSFVSILAALSYGFSPDFIYIGLF